MKTFYYNKIIKATIIYLVAVIIIMVLVLAGCQAMKYPKVSKTQYHENTRR